MKTKLLRQSSKRQQRKEGRKRRRQQQKTRRHKVAHVLRVRRETRCQTQAGASNGAIKHTRTHRDTQTEQWRDSAHQTAKAGFSKLQRRYGAR